MYKITFKHTVEETYEAFVEASCEAEALELLDDDPFNYVDCSKDPINVQGLKIDILETMKIKTNAV